MSKQRVLQLLSIGILAFMLIMTAGQSHANEQKSRSEVYIDQYKDIAIREMKRTGIPASIKLAQGMLESGNGMSRLSTKGNNHFGIKCPGGWDGKTMYHDDDAPDECFRVYKRAEDSWRDHSEFLMNGWRYQFLFELDPKDYKAWAEGLSEAGYATNPLYPQLLVNLIESHELYRFDQGIQSRDAIAADASETQEGRVFKYNEVEAVRVREGETYEDITEKFLYFNYQLARYNDIERGAELEAGQVVYLKPKKWWPSERYHTIRNNETMWEISQMYGVRLGRLYRRNLLDQEAGEEPAIGETVHLMRRRSTPPEIRKGPVPEYEKPAAEDATRPLAGRQHLTGSTETYG